MRRPISTLAVLALVLLTTACAAGEGVDDEPTPAEGATTIRVAHDLRAATTLTVHLVTPRGDQRRLGVVRPGGTDVFVLDERPLSGSYRLVAELHDGRTFESRPFVLTGRDGVEWSPGDNILTPLSRD